MSHEEDSYEQGSEYLKRRRSGRQSAQRNFGLEGLSGSVEDTLPSIGQTTQEVLDAILGASPQFAQQQFDTFSQYAPQTIHSLRNIAEREMPLLQQLQQELISKGREGELADIERFTPQLNDINRLSQGQGVTDARAMLQSQIFGDLALGRELGADELRDVQQFQRAGEVSRGFGTGTGSANREAVSRALAGRDLQQRRQQSASGLMQLEKSLTPDPFSTISGLSNSSTNNAQQMFGAGLSAVPNGINSAFQAAQLGGQQQQVQQQAGLQALQAQLGAQFLPQFL
tara:strand:+ start:150 stop:1004 length:855 start_codon:yes stop_codon:yes gene_type:complete